MSHLHGVRSVDDRDPVVSLTRRIVRLDRDLVLFRGMLSTSELRVHIEAIERQRTALARTLAARTSRTPEDV